MIDFKKLRIWNEAFQICTTTYELTKKFPSHELYSLTNQMRRCSVSVVSNIAEGGSRSSEKDKVRFLEIALGSAFELETQLLISVPLGYAAAADVDALEKQLHQLQKSINALRKKIMADKYAEES